MRSGKGDEGKGSRRRFLQSGLAVGAGMALVGNLDGGTAMEAGHRRRRYCIVGTGSRSFFYQRAIEGPYAAHAELVGICDTNAGRMRYSQERSKAAGAKPAQAYEAEAFDRMVRETKPDMVIVTTMDSTHHTYIVRAMEMGVDVHTEKPMTTDHEKCQAIIDAQNRTGRFCRVGFNYRYSPARTQLKQLLMDGAIGDVLSVDFHWLLNTHHGADYFRRWHSQKRFSGGLMVHKATHHFDLMNWWLSAVPQTVRAIGKREFYTPAMAQRMGLSHHHTRCRTCPESAQCAFYLDLEAERKLRLLYLENEQYDGYFRDRCVFRPEIDIEDTMSVLVRYDTGVDMTYSLNAMNSWEGYQINFNGTKGRLEHTAREKIYVSGTDTEQGGLEHGGVTTRVIPLRGPAQDIPVWEGTGGHGGGDKPLLDSLFLPNPPEDKYFRTADHRGGAYSILTGIAANMSMETGQSVRIKDLVHGLGYPVYPAMPTKGEAVPMP
jgi:predicted dehydrogenase